MSEIYYYNRKLKYRDLRKKLIDETGGVCYWCGCKVVERERKGNENFKPDQATIDHTIDRYSRKRGQIVKKVLCCYKCNQERSAEAVKRNGGKPNKHNG